MSTAEFNQLLVGHADFLKPFAITLTRDSDAAKDLYQETLFRALSNKDKYHVGTNIKAWLYTIMRNIFINNYRRKAKQQTIFQSTSQELAPVATAVESSTAESSLRLKEIQQAIHRLPELFRNLDCRHIPRRAVYKHLPSFAHYYLSITVRLISCLCYPPLQMDM